jgi:hypothetical protein
MSKPDFWVFLINTLTVSADSMNLICNSSSRYVGTCLAVFLMKLKMDCRTKCYQFCFDLNVSFSSRNSLVTEFGPINLDLEHISHEEFCQKHTTTFAKTLFTNDDA